MKSPTWAMPADLRMGQNSSHASSNSTPTRPVTDAVQLYSGMAPRDHNWNWNDADPLLAKLDIVGYNYQMGKYNQDHQRVPDRVIAATESYPRDMFAILAMGGRSHLGRGRLYLDRLGLPW